jgi:hypothetical protein
MFTWLFRLVVGSVMLAGALWLLRAAMKWWIDGPQIEPPTAPWPPLVDPAANGVDEDDPARGSTSINGAGPVKRGGAQPANGSANGVSAGPAYFGANGVSVGSTNGTGAATTPGLAPARAREPGLASNGVITETPAVPPQILGQTWVRLDETGAALTSHPVKAKESSRLYHLPGMLAYDRTRPDRCYPSAEDAEADGFVRAKR